MVWHYPVRRVISLDTLLESNVLSMERTRQIYFRKLVNWRLDSRFSIYLNVDLWKVLQLSKN